MILISPGTIAAHKWFWLLTEELQKYAAESLVPLQIEGYEIDLLSSAKTPGRRLNREKQFWFVL
ncbi:MAG: hypothetical protein WCK54_19360 [Desulfuromonadales bacterium]